MRLLASLPQISSFGAADHVLDRDQRGDLAQGPGVEIGAVGRPRLAGPEVDADRVMETGETDRVGAGASVDVVEGKRIVLVDFDDGVVTGTTVDGVNACPASEDRVAVAAMNDVVTGSGNDLFGIGAAPDFIIAGAVDHVLDRAKRGDLAQGP